MCLFSVNTKMKKTHLSLSCSESHRDYGGVQLTVIHLIYVLKVYYVPTTVLSPGDTAMNKKGKNLCTCEAYIP